MDNPANENMDSMFTEEETERFWQALNEEQCERASDIDCSSWLEADYSYYEG